MKKAAKILIIIGSSLSALLALALCVFVLGLIAFVALGEQRYFAAYVSLQGYYSFINVMFLLDYFLMGIGSLGIPVLIGGFILKALSKNS